MLAVAGPADASSNGKPAIWVSGLKAVIMAVLCLVIGVKLTGDAISGLSM